MTAREEAMIVIANAVTQLISQRPTTLVKEDAIIAAIIGALTVVRVDGLDETAIVREARRVAAETEMILSKMPWGTM